MFLSFTAEVTDGNFRWLVVEPYKFKSIQAKVLQYSIMNFEFGILQAYEF